MEAGDSEKEGVDVPRPPPFLLFLPPITNMRRFIKSDVYKLFAY
ncbi:hypothetical protein HMPREF0083_05645 [Aneurinibacillus aneurinilyticus ATCC 12856]|uniref:Uncharacterized protein n=1 Tax=Aneurinibacillus aneurinilyticus ATCC 12856 TaxID=649747 RepID=U1WTJ6_ANEAE|nr:hypothetical protein HMPREF0083_05645 [Aneurinibacillus aneurinilyticus ATCC 12856]